MNNLASAIRDQVTGSSPRPDWDDYFMAQAWLASARSPCERLHVGCVIVSGGPLKCRVISTGYNGFLPGAPHVSRVRDGHELSTVHAEQNAIVDAAKRGVSIHGAWAYVTHFPCVHCAKLLAASGINRVVYYDDYKNDPVSTELFNDAGVLVRKFDELTFDSNPNHHAGMTVVDSTPIGEGVVLETFKADDCTEIQKSIRPRPEPTHFKDQRMDGYL